MDRLIQDIRYTLRQLRRAPGFTAVAVLTLALGIGATTVIFGVVSALVIRPLPVEDPGTLITFAEVRQGSVANSVFSYPGIQEYRERSRGAARIAAYGMDELSASGDGVAELLSGGFVTGNYFEVLGIRPALGRFFTPDEEVPGVPEAVAVLGHHIWQERYGGSQDAIGRSIRLNGETVTIIGVAPPGFQGVELGFRIDVWTPIPTYAALNPGANIDSIDGRFWLVPVARLGPGVTAPQAEALLTSVGLDLASRPAQQTEIGGVQVWPATGLPPGMGTPVRLFLGLLFGAAALVLLIASVNVAGMLLARATVRQREIGIRLALGASRPRLVGQLLTESTLLFLLGGAGGLLLAHWALDVGATVAQSRLGASLGWPISLALGLDRSVVLFALVTALATGILFGLAPAFRASRPDVASTLKGSGVGVIVGRSRLRSAFVTAQIAMSLLLLVTAGLLGRSLQSALSIDPGIDAEGVLIAGLNLIPHGYDRERGEALVAQLRERLEAHPDIQGASFTRRGTLDGMIARYSVEIPGVEAPAGERGVMIDHNEVDHAYFPLLGIPLLEGRPFTEEDRLGAPWVAVVNETMARRYWPAGDALGARVRVGGSEVEIVGIARDAKYRTLDEDPLPFIYRPFAQGYSPQMALHVRSAGTPPGGLVPILRRELQLIDPDLPLVRPAPLGSRIIASGFLPQQLGGLFIGAFGLVGLLLTSVGLYGVLSYNVGQRTREIGVRVAVGASATSVLGMVVRQGLRLLALGLAVGLLMALAATRLLSGLLFGVGPTDPLTFIVVPLVLVVVAFLASYLPARRATRVDPMAALRAE